VIVDGLHQAFDVVPVRTPTLPPATHTNTYLVGETALTVFDPASPWEDQQQLLAGVLDERRATGVGVERIVLTHHHHDHVAGAMALARHLRQRGHPVPIAAHPLTAGLLRGMIHIDEVLHGGDILQAGGVNLNMHHTPGHAPGHLVFHHEQSGALIAGDMVAGVGTIAIDPTDGDLGQYLASLAAMRGLGPSALLPAHGPVLQHADSVLAYYVAHRHMRSDQIRAALEELGSRTASELVPAIYPELPPYARPLGTAQITSHLRWLLAEGLVAHGTGGRWQLA
jgi:endoribonuclease LACTB2